VQEFIRHLQGKYGNCHVVSVCQPTVPVFAAISLMASRGEKTPLSMIMMGGPIDARLSPTSVNNLATTKPYEWFENNVIYPVPASFAGKGRRVYPGFLQHTGFVAMNPDRHATSHYDYFKNLIKGDDASTEAHRKFYDEYNAVLDMDADYYLETIKTVFQDFKLVNGTWDVLSPQGILERVKPGDIKTTAVMTVEGELDDISGSGQTRAALDMCSGVAAGQKTHLEAKGAGHYGIFSGRRWRDVVYPAVKTFILEHNKPLAQIENAPAAAEKAARPMKQARQKAPATDEMPALPVAAEGVKTAVKRRAKSTTAGLKSTVAAGEGAVKDLSVADEKPAQGKPVLVAVKNTAARPESVAEAVAAQTAAPLAPTVAAVAPAAGADVETAFNTPIPPEKSAA
jgi:poly(3-hydroxybutyrate) depolymerase